MLQILNYDRIQCVGKKNTIVKELGTAFYIKIFSTLSLSGILMRSLRDFTVQRSADLHGKLS